MTKSFLIAVGVMAVIACSPTESVKRSSPDRIIYNYHWVGQIEGLTLDANRYCDRFGGEAHLERQDLLTLEYVCK